MYTLKMYAAPCIDIWFLAPHIRRCRSEHVHASLVGCMAQKRGALMYASLQSRTELIKGFATIHRGLFSTNKVEVVARFEWSEFSC